MLRYTLFYITNARLKLEKTQVKPKQHPDADLSLFENYWRFYPRYHPKIIGDFLENVQKANVSVLMRLYN